MKSRLVVYIIAAWFAVSTSTVVQAEEAKITVYKNPMCGCCEKWIEHMQDNGFQVETIKQHDLQTIKSMSGIKPEHASCHTALVEGYVIEGHVPAMDVRRLLKERPQVKGLAAPGMPMGSPGMEGPRQDRYQVLSIDHDGNSAVFAQH